MPVMYSLCVEQKLEHKDIGNYTTYGIELEGENITVDDVSCERRLVEQLVDDLNEGQAEPIHLFDIIEDRLALIGFNLI